MWLNKACLKHDIVPDTVRQYGGVATAHLDDDLAPFVRISFLKHFKDGLKYLGSKGKDYSVFEETYGDSINYASIDAELNIFEQYNKKAYRYALDMLEKEGKQAAQALWHNLNSLESRPGSQLPFTSVNFGLNYTFEGRCITRWCLEASMDGIGIGHAVPIFPISIFKYKKDVNDRPGTPNYDLLQLSIKSTCATIYPNYVNCDWTSNDSGVHPIRVVDNPELDKSYKVTIGIDKKLYENITLEEFFNLIESEEENRNGILVKDVRDKNITIHDITHSIFSPHVQKFKDSGMSDDDLLKLPMAKVHFLSKSGDKISVTTDTFTHDYTDDTIPNKQFVYVSEYLMGEQYDPDTEMATMGAVDGEEVITYKLGGRLFVESFSRAWNRVLSFYGSSIVHSKYSLYINTPGMLIYDSSSSGFVSVKRMTRNNDMGRWNRISSTTNTILLTSDHPLPTQRGRVETKDIVVGDQLISLNSQYSEVSDNNVISNDLAWALGVILCDGCYSSGGVVCCFALDEYELANKLAYVLRSEFGMNPKIKERHRGIKGNYIEVVAYSSSVSEYMINFFEGVNKNDRHIPSTVFADFSMEAKVHFLAGMIDADGYIRRTSLNKDGSAKGNNIFIGSTNHELAVQQMLLAKTIGLPSSISVNYYKGIQHPNHIRYVVKIRMSKVFEDTIVCNKKNMYNKNFIAYRISELSEIKEIQYFGYRDRYEYDVETVSDRFDVSGINSHNCRTMIGYDRHGMGYKKTGRGNVAPVTMILPKLGIEYGICLGERKEADVEGFFKAFDDLLDIAEKSLVDRFNYVCSQNPQAGWFMYENDSIADGNKVAKSGHIYDAMKHGTLALGYIGIANTCYAMFGKYHHEDPEVMKFADRIISTIKKRADEASERHNLNFSTYSTPKLNWAA